MKKILLELMEIINEMSWEQSNREVSGHNYHIKVSEQLSKLADKIKKLK